MEIKRRNLLIFSVIVLFGLSIGGGIYMENKRFNDEMFNVVGSSQARKIIESELEMLDSKALSPGGKINSYEINYETIRHNPMGAIMFDVTINNDSQLIVSYSLNKRTGALKNGGLVISEKLSNFLNR